MLSSVFQSSTIPALEQVVSFTQARHAVLAGNIANVDTPGYQARDLSVEEFQERLQAAIQSARRAAPASPGERPAPAAPALARVAAGSHSVLRHDLANVSMEEQVTEMVKNQLQHNMAISLLTQQYQSLKTAISGTVT
ncbi:MAG: flagellar basal body rod protein FlgB [Thermoguttaceae bacterium]|jgi:flagellar basal-body rod protein FlgB